MSLRRIALFLPLLLLALDQASKAWVESSLAFQHYVPVMPMLALFRTYNTGIAFSLLAGMPDWALIAITIAIATIVAWLWFHLESHRIWAVMGFALIMGGAIGNLIDRVFRGHVVDFILIHTESWSFAIFNLADSFITVGAGFIILDELLEWRRAGSKTAGGNRD